MSMDNPFERGDASDCYAHGEHNYYEKRKRKLKLLKGLKLDAETT